MSQASTTTPFAPAVTVDSPGRRLSYADDMSTTSSSSSISDVDQAMTDPNRLIRPRLGSRKSSGTIIIPRDSLQVEFLEGEEDYEEGDARTMSPRRSSEEIDKMGEEARRAMVE
jgi:hypothetical protein